MQFAKIQLKAGINRDQTHYSATGGWFDCDKVRFWASLPEKIGGWTPYSRSAFLGTARAITTWASNAADFFIGLGTHLKYYIFRGGTLADITPLRRTVTLPANSLTTTSGSNIVKVADINHGAIADDFVTISGAVGFNGIPAGELNGEHQITFVTNTGLYQFTVTSLASATGTGGGTPTLAYQINTGLDSNFVGTGWGAGPWGRGTWGSRADVTVAGTLLRMWSHDQYGEDLIFCYNVGPLFYYDVTFPFARAVRIDSIAGASDVPLTARRVLVSERHVIAFATTPLGGGPEDPMLVRWSDEEDYLNWTPTEENAAGDYRLTVGSRIVTAVRCRQEILILTDAALYTMRYIGGQFIYGFELVGASTTIAGPNAIVAIDDRAFWMGTDAFYVWNGKITQLPCTVNDFVFTRLNLQQIQKAYAGSNTGFGEVTWFFPSIAGMENDSYVTCNYLDNLWYYGSMVRTTWVDTGTYQYPLATDVEKKWVFAHEFGTDDGSQNPPAPIYARIRSAPFEIQDGYQVSFVTRLIPDITFRDIGSGNPSVQMTLIPQNYPGAASGAPVSKTVQRGVTVDIEQFTKQKPVRLRGRALIFEVSSNEVGMSWRMGTPRLEIRTDGRR
jgi:hypothetical protein